MLTGETEQKLSLVAQRVWAAQRRDKTLQERLLSDPARFLQESGIVIPDHLETRVSLNSDSVSFRFRLRQTGIDANGSDENAPVFGDGSILFRFEFQWIWD